MPPDIAKRKIEKDLCSIDPNNRHAEEVILTLVKVFNKAKKTHDDLKIHLEHETDDEGQIISHSICLTGKKDESDYEWHRRLTWDADSIRRTIENGQNIVNRTTDMKNSINDINKALENSPLKCVDCGKPECSKSTSYVTDNKAIIICHNCYEARKVKYEQKNNRKI